MKKRLGLALFAALLIQVHEGKSQDWPSVTKEMKPWTRWWWLGSAVDTKNIDRELTLFDKAGFGGVEITPIYGAKGYENRYVKFLSPDWMNLLRFTVQKSNALGMGVDMNLGTGWPFGGPQVNEDIAATKLFLDEIVLQKGEKLTFPLQVSDKKQTHATLQALRAFRSSGEEINLDTYVSNIADTWSAPEDVRVIALFSGRTRQQVKRAAPGGEGYTLDHLGKAGPQAYFQTFADAFGSAALGVRTFFNDSYEVYGADYTEDFLKEFEVRKGYRLQDHLLDWAGKSGDKATEARVKSDYREVLSSLLQNNFLVPFTQFANRYGATSRNQAHGSPGNLIDLYATSGIAEVETFGSSNFAIPGLRRDSTDVRNVDPDPMMFKFASSATNISGKKYTSSETFTWLTEHFKTSLSQMKPEVEQLLLNGVNHVFYHGSTYSPEDVAYPGWLFYASVNFTTNNSFWPHLIGLNTYITRVQSILQTAKADNELLIYWPIYDIWNQAGGMMKTLSVHHVDNWLHPTAFYKKSLELQNRGYSFDFVSDAVLQQSKVVDKAVVTSDNANPYKAIFVPTAQFFSEETLDKILKLANDGATVVFQTLPEEVAGLSDLAVRTEKFNKLIASLGFKADNPNQYTSYGKGKIYLTQDVHSALETEKLYGERLSRLGLKYTRRVNGDDHYYYIVNHRDRTVDEEVRLNTEAKSYTLLDPQTGDIFKLPVVNHAVRLQLKPGYAWVVLVSDQPNDKAHLYSYQDNLKEAVVLDNPWKVSFVSGGPTLPKARTITALSSWTTWNDAQAEKFAGTAAYETTFSLTKEEGKSYLLQLGKVAESAKVLINGQDAGIVWAFPFELNIEKWLKNGNNTIRIEVANLMANRVKDLDQRKVQWRNYHEINFVNIDYKNFDASGWTLQESGLVGPVKIFSY